MFDYTSSISASGVLAANTQVFGKAPTVLSVADAKAAIDDGQDIKRLVISDTAANIKAGFADLKGWAGERILKDIRVTDNAEITLRVADLEGVQAETSTVLKRLQSATVKVADIGTELKDGLDELKLYSRRLDGVSAVATYTEKDADGVDVVSNGTAVLSITADEFRSNKKTLSRIEGAVVEVTMEGAYANYRFKARNDGSLSVSGTSASTRGLNASGVNFLKFSDGTRVVASSGNARIDSLIELGSRSMWNTDAFTTGQLIINSSAENADANKADRYQIMPGVFALDQKADGTDAAIALKYSFYATADRATTLMLDADKVGKDFRPMTAVQKAVVKDVLDYMSHVINVTFTEQNAVDTTTNLRFGTNKQESSAGYARYPYASSTDKTTEIFLAHNASTNDFSGFVDADSAAAGFQFAEEDLVDLRASYGWQTVLHEMGHALGLKHPGNYNAGGGGASPPYLPGVLDSNQWSVMSYNGAPSSTSTVAGSSQATAKDPQTLMTYDIAALQFLYGKSQSTSSLDDFQVTDFSASWSGFQTLWSPDGIGLDTGERINRTLVDMRPGTFSSVARYNDTGLAFGSEFSRVAGGSGADRIYAGNYSAMIDGGADSDTLLVDGKLADWKLDRGEELEDLTAANDGSVSTINGDSLATAIRLSGDFKRGDVAKITYDGTDYEHTVAGRISTDITFSGGYLADDEIEVTVNGEPYTYVVGADGEVAADIAAGLRDLINVGTSGTHGVTASVANGKLVLERTDNGDSALDGAGALTIAVAENLDGASTGAATLGSNTLDAADRDAIATALASAITDAGITDLTARAVGDVVRFDLAEGELPTISASVDNSVGAGSGAMADETAATLVRTLDDGSEQRLALSNIEKVRFYDAVMQSAVHSSVEFTA